MISGCRDNDQKPSRYVYIYEYHIMPYTTAGCTGTTPRSRFQILFDAVIKYDFMDILGLNKSRFKWVWQMYKDNESNEYVNILFFHHQKEGGTSNWAWGSIWHYTVYGKLQKLDNTAMA